MKTLIVLLMFLSSLSFAQTWQIDVEDCNTNIESCYLGRYSGATFGIDAGIGEAVESSPVELDIRLISHPQPQSSLSTGSYIDFRSGTDFHRVLVTSHCSFVTIQFIFGADIDWIRVRDTATGGQAYDETFYSLDDMIITESYYSMDIEVKYVCEQ